MPKDEIPRGQLSTIILSTLLDGDKYGYEIIDTIKDKTNGGICVKQPSLYSSLKRMEEQGLISSYWRDSEIGGRRHYYSITDYGKKYTEKWQLDLNIFNDQQKQNNQNELIINNDDQKDLNNSDIVSGTILQQKSIFDNKKEESVKEEKEKLEQINNSYVQYDLFSSPTLIAEPSEEIFDSIKQLRQDAVTNLEQKEDELTKLRNINQSEIKTSFLADNHNYNATQDVKSSFFELSKKQKSFANAIKDRQEIITTNDLEYTEDININQNEEIETNTIEEQSYNINLENVLNNQSQKQVTSDNSLDHCINTDTEFEIPTIYQTTTEFKEEDDLSDNEGSVEFIDLDNFNNNSNINDDITQREDYTNQFAPINDNINIDDKITDDIPLPLNSNDDGIFITEKISYDSMPKVKKIAPARFENYNRYNSIIDDRITKLYDDKALEQVEEKNIEPVNKDIFEYQKEDDRTKESTNLYDLNSHYEDQNIKFRIYNKQNNSTIKNNYIKINKLNFISFSIITLLAILSSIIMYICLKEIQSNWNWVYLVVPILILTLDIYYLCKYFNNKNAISLKLNIVNNNWIYRLSISFVIILLAISINLLCGMNFENFSKYLTTLLYPIIISLLYPSINLVNYIFIKMKK